MKSAEGWWVPWSAIRQGLDYPALLVTVALFALGLLTLVSASAGVRSGVAPYPLRQLVWGGVSAVAYVLVLRTGYQRFMRFAYSLYGVALLLLLAILIVGKVTKGAQSWFNLGIMRFQPSELAKVALILVLARYCSEHPPHDLKNLSGFVAVAGASALLVLLQPDLGSTLVYGAIILSIMVVVGTPQKYLFALIGGGLVALPFLWNALKPYQQMRFLVFLDPSIDPQGAGYNVIQSRIAVGSGGLFGKGFLGGTQGRLHFLPEPHTDFIFSVFAEEFGFLGGVLVISLFAFLFWRLLRAALMTKSVSGKVVVVGVSAWIWFQIIESVAMSMGLAPVTGIPLPLFSYGGSSLLAEVCALAFVQSICVSAKAERLE